jgi:uncharacterized membrane protein
MLLHVFDTCYLIIHIFKYWYIYIISPKRVSACCAARIIYTPSTCKLYGTNHIYLHNMPLWRVVGQVWMCPCCMFLLTHMLSNIYKHSFTCTVQRLVYNFCLFVYFLLAMVLFVRLHFPSRRRNIVRVCSIVCILIPVMNIYL